MEFKLPYYVENCGDGSVSVEFCQSEEEADAKDAAMDEGWGESSASFVKLKVVDNKLYYETYEYNEKARKGGYVWKEVRQ